MQRKWIVLCPGVVFSLHALIYVFTQTDAARLLLLCSPHNPIGRVWQTLELQALLEICQRYGITVVSNEIHAEPILANSAHC